MRLKNVFYSLYLLIFGLINHALADIPIPPRIGATTIDKRHVQRLYIAAGRSSILIFPCNIKTFSTGPTKDISALVNERDSKMLEVWLGKAGGQPAGLKVICNDHFFAFDVIPSRTTHQDFVSVKGAFGLPTTFSGVRDEVTGHELMSSKNVEEIKNRNMPKVIRIISSSKDGDKK